METVKLINKKGEIIERLKIQYEPNMKIWSERGWSVYEKPKPQPKVEPKIEPISEPIAKAPKKKSKKKAK